MGWNFFTLLTPRHKQHTVSAAILLTAGVIYGALTICYTLNPELNLKLVRYIDWIITVPLLVYQMFTMLEFRHRKRSSLTASIICTMLMLSLGWIGESGVGSKTILGLLSTVFGFYTFMVLINGIQKKDRGFFTFVGVVWFFYPVVYFFLPGQVILGYAIADVAAKIGSAFYLLHRFRSYDIKRD